MKNIKYLIVLCIIMSGCATTPDPNEELIQMLRDMGKKGQGVPADFNIPVTPPMFIPVPVIYSPYGYHGYY